MKHYGFSLAAVFVCILALTAVGFGQAAGTGAISGLVTDPSGAVVAGATIKATDQTSGQSRTVVSSNDGKYLVPLLLPHTYQVEVTKSGFKQLVRTDIPVHVTETVVVDLHLSMGETKETVTVSASAEALRTEDSSLGGTIDEKEVSTLPLVTRNYAQILGLSPGVSAEAFDAADLGRGSTTFVSNGSHSSDNNFQMNGVEINDLQGSGGYSGGTATPNPDSIQEFKVQTSQYDASSGRNAGANVDVMTKGGSNALHGSAWEFFRNDVLNSNSYFNNQTKQPKGVLKQNQFGFALGGPVKKDKLLFFTSYQGTRQRNGIDNNCSSSVNLPVLTDDRSAAGLAASVGLSTGYGGYDPLGRRVTAANVSSQAQKLFNLKLPDGQYLIPNPQTLVMVKSPVTGLQAPIGLSTFSAACPYTENQFITNLDWMQSAKSTFRARFFFADSEGLLTIPGAAVAGSGSLPGSPTTNPQNFRNFSLTHTYVFNSNLVNQAEIGFHRVNSGAIQQFPFSYSDIGAITPSFDNARPNIIVSGGLSTGGSGNTIAIAQNTYVYQDTLSWVHGKHALRFGASLSRAQDNISEFAYGAYTVFLNYPGMMLGQAPYNPYLTEDLAGLLGRNWRVWDGSLYMQDDYRITSRLTLNLGFRYERLGDFGEINGRNSSIDPTLLNPRPTSPSLAGIMVSDNFPGTLPAGVVSSGNNLGINGDGQNTFNPRVGFAWQLPGTQRVVLRGGWGVYHQRATGQPYFQQLTNQPFGQIREDFPLVTRGFDHPFQPDPGAFPQFVPYSPATKQAVTFLDPKLRPPMFQKYSMSLQTQLSKDMVWEVSYAGMRGTHMFIQRSINQAVLDSNSTVANVASRVPYVGFSSYGMVNIESTGFAWYNSLQTSVSKRFSHGLQFLASYTYARDLGNAANTTTGPNGGQIFGDQNNPRGNYGVDNFIRPQRFIVTAVYALPGPKNHNSFAGELLAGWRVSAITLIQSGHRLPVVNSANTNSAYGTVQDFAQMVPGCDPNTSGSTTSRLDNWLNRDCFFKGTSLIPYPIVGSDGKATGFGNTGPGIITGPGQANTDISLVKTFGLKWPSEKANVEFRTEFFNVFNHPLFADPNNDVSSPSFGTIIRTVANPRVMQFALKLNF